MDRDRESILRQFGKAVAERRLRAKLTQEHLAERSGLHRTYIGSVERGKRNPTIMTLVAICAGLECSPGDLVKEVLG